MNTSTPNSAQNQASTTSAGINSSQQTPSTGPTTTNTRKEETCLMKTVKSREEFVELLKSTKDKYILVELYAAWCGACKTLAKQFENLAEQHQDKLEVLKIDVDDLEELAIEYDVNVMPSYMIMRDGKKLEHYFGSKTEQLQGMVEKYLEKSS